MKVDIFDFELDKNLIASQPADPRDSCKLLDISEPPAIRDRIFYELPDLFKEGDVLVFNDTKVIPGRLYARRGQAEKQLRIFINTACAQFCLPLSKRRRGALCFSD